MFQTLLHHLEHCGLLHPRVREPCQGPLVVHLLNVTECHAPHPCGLRYGWHPPTT